MSNCYDRFGICASEIESEAHPLFNCDFVVPDGINCFHLYFNDILGHLPFYEMALLEKQLTLISVSSTRR